MSSRHAHPSTRRGRDDDRGYVIVLTAILILPLMAFAGFATDIGAWYAQANRLQRAADAAALAGVVHLPNMAAAEAAAEDVAERNGFVDGVDDIDIDIQQVGTDRLNVLITDESADLFFASLVIERIEIERSATAEWIAPLAMGSPDNAFGNEGNAAYPGRPNYFGAISAPYTARRQGDNIATRCNDSTAWNWCISSNPTYDSRGYYYAVEIP
ncbi:MAG: pilus assembly protein TadG-related protein, partial [Actinomycetota bacterium]